MMAYDTLRYMLYLFYSGLAGYGYYTILQIFYPDPLPQYFSYLAGIGCYVLIVEKRYIIAEDKEKW